MILLTRNNYEAFLLDFFEGNLSEQEIVALRDFALKNPDLEIDLEDFDLPSLEQEHLIFEGKEHLKEIAEAETLLIKQIDQDLSDLESARLAALEVKHAELKKEKKLIASTILVPETVVYQNKQRLKKTAVIPMYAWGSLAAACFIGFFMWFGDAASTGVYSFAKVNTNNSFSILSEDLSQMAINVAPLFEDENDITSAAIEEVSETDQDLNKVETSITKSPQKELKPRKRKDLSGLERVKPKADIIPNSQLAMTSPSNTAMDTLQQAINAEQNLASNSENDVETLTVKEFVNLKTREKVFGYEEPTTDDLKGDEIASNVAKGLDKITKGKVSYETETQQGKKKVKVKLGKIEFYRSRG